MMNIPGVQPVPAVAGGQPVWEWLPILTPLLPQGGCAQPPPHPDARRFSTQSAETPQPSCPPAGDAPGDLHEDFLEFVPVIAGIDASTDTRFKKFTAFDGSGSVRNFFERTGRADRFLDGDGFVTMGRDAGQLEAYKISSLTPRPYQTGFGMGMTFKFTQLPGAYEKIHLLSNLSQDSMFSSSDGDDADPACYILKGGGIDLYGVKSGIGIELKLTHHANGAGRELSLGEIGSGQEIRVTLFRGNTVNASYYDSRRATIKIYRKTDTGYERLFSDVLGPVPFSPHLYGFLFGNAEDYLKVGQNSKGRLKVRLVDGNPVRIARASDYRMDHDGDGVPTGVEIRHMDRGYDPLHDQGAVSSFEDVLQTGQGHLDLQQALWLAPPAGGIIVLEQGATHTPEPGPYFYIPSHIQSVKFVVMPAQSAPFSEDQIEAIKALGANTGPAAKTCVIDGFFFKINPRTAISMAGESGLIFSLKPDAGHWLQTAIDAAPEGSVIRLGPGAHDIGNVTANRNVTIRGSAGGGTVVNGSISAASGDLSVVIQDIQRVDRVVRYSPNFEPPDPSHTRMFNDLVSRRVPDVIRSREVTAFPAGDELIGIYDNHLYRKSAGGSDWGSPLALNIPMLEEEGDQGVILQESAATAFSMGGRKYFAFLVNELKNSYLRLWDMNDPGAAPRKLILPSMGKKTVSQSDPGAESEYIIKNRNECLTVMSLGLIPGLGAGREAHKYRPPTRSRMPDPVPNPPSRPSTPPGQGIEGEPGISPEIPSYPNSPGDGLWKRGPGGVRHRITTEFSGRTRTASDFCEASGTEITEMSEIASESGFETVGEAVEAGTLDLEAAGEASEAGAALADPIAWMVVAAVEIGVGLIDFIADSIKDGHASWSCVNWMKGKDIQKTYDAPLELEGVAVGPGGDLYVKTGGEVKKLSAVIRTSSMDTPAEPKTPEARRRARALETGPGEFENAWPGMLKAHESLSLSRVDIWDAVFSEAPGRGPRPFYPLVGLDAGKAPMFGKISGRESLRTHFIEDPGYHRVDHAWKIEKTLDAMESSPVGHAFLSLVVDDSITSAADMFFKVKNAMSGGRIRFESQDMRFDGVAASRGMTRFGWKGSRLWVKHSHDDPNGKQDSPWMELTRAGLPPGRNIRSMSTNAHEVKIVFGKHYYYDTMTWLLDDAGDIYLFAPPGDASSLSYDDLYHPHHWRLHAEKRTGLPANIREIFALSGDALMAADHANRLYYSAGRHSAWQTVENDFSIPGGGSFEPVAFEIFAFGEDVSLAASDSGGNIYYALYLKGTDQGPLRWKKTQVSESGITDFSLSHDGRRLAVLDGSRSLWVNMEPDSSGVFSAHDEIVPESAKIAAPAPACGYLDSMPDLRVHEWQSAIYARGALCREGAAFHTREDGTREWGAPPYPERLWLDASHDAYPLSWRCGRFESLAGASCDAMAAPAPETVLTLTHAGPGECVYKDECENQKPPGLIKAIGEKIWSFNQKSMNFLTHLLGMDQGNTNKIADPESTKTRVKFGGGSFISRERHRLGHSYYSLAALGLSDQAGFHHVSRAYVPVEGDDLSAVRFMAQNLPGGDAPLAGPYPGRIYMAGFGSSIGDGLKSVGSGLKSAGETILGKTVSDPQNIYDAIRNKDYKKALEIFEGDILLASGAAAFLLGGPAGGFIGMAIFSGAEDEPPPQYLFDDFGTGPGGLLFAWKDRSLYARMKDHEGQDAWWHMTEPMKQVPARARLKAMAPGRDGRVWALDTDGSLYRYGSSSSFKIPGMGLFGLNGKSSGDLFKKTMDSARAMGLIDSNVWSWTLRKDPRVNPSGAKIVDIFPLAGGAIIGVDEDRGLYYSGSSSEPWKKIHGNFGVYDGERIHPFAPSGFDLFYYDWGSDTFSGKAMLAASDSSGNLYCAAFSPDKDHLPLWHKIHSYASTGMSGFDFSDDGRRLAFIAKDGHVRLSSLPGVSWARFHEEFGERMPSDYLDHIIALYNHGGEGFRAGADRLREFLRSGPSSVPAPVPVEKLSGKTRKGSVKVSWRHSAGEPGSIFYHLQIARNASFVSDASGDVFDLFMKNASYSVKTGDDGALHARVRSMDIFGNASDFADLGSVVKDTTPPEKVKGLKAVPDKTPGSGTYNAISLSWSPISNKGKDFAKWRIYRKRSFGSGKIKNVAGLIPLAEIVSAERTSYVDASADAGEWYQHAVSAVDDLGNEDMSVFGAWPAYVNNAPSLPGSVPDFSPIPEDERDSAGDMVSRFLQGASDPEGDEIGMAVISAKSDGGRWEYRRPGGDWTAFVSAGETNARLLEPTAGIRFVPSADWNGTAQIAFRAWDQTKGRPGRTADVSENGEYHPYSAQSAPAVIQVRPVNDPPSFVRGPDLNIIEDSGAQVVEKWASEIAKGPKNESDQATAFVLTHDRETAPGAVPNFFHQAPVMDENGTLSYMLRPDANGVANVTVRLKDDGGRDHGGIDLDENEPPVRFTITARPVNDPPSFSAAEQSVDEDAGLQRVPLSGWAQDILPGPENEKDQTVQFTLVSTSSPGLFSTQPAISSDGVLSFAPAPDQNGQARVTVLAKDDGGVENGGADQSAPVTLGITVRSVNDAPSFSKGADIRVRQSAGRRVLRNWAKHISAGPADESGQRLRFEVKASRPSLFAVQPAISSGGTLTFTPRRNRSGKTSVTAVLKDGGGKDRNGEDQSAPARFNIRVLRVSRPGSDASNDAPAQPLLESPAAP
ncbi:hypothetical protein EPICR_10325 [Candidatus Desulfarcum epimagneticum]|uniref:Cadherin domain-containing protein n=1 Tax=uncultured Desulfobacteraceae bacterium TaxID=218296 RepID=A0A484HI07_9BACT|nr:hypothetical protein EPICR_10325 [uncultured Desulfobacteraceae bacterium]